MSYHQITSGERYMISALRKQGLSLGQVGRELGRHRSTIGRELRRNGCRHGYYRPSVAVTLAVSRRSVSRRNQRFSPTQLRRVEALLVRQWSPEQVAGYLRRHRELQISHETIYRHIWKDRRRGGGLHLHLRGARKRRRKRYGSYDSRGRLAGKRHISERPAACDHRTEIGHWEIDTILGTGSRHCLLSLVDRKTGFLLLGKLAARTTQATTDRTIGFVRQHPRRFATITADNGTEFHDYDSIERATDVPFYFATPHHAWERGTSENTNGLIRQYAPKGRNLARLTPDACTRIASHLNRRPRKRLGFRTPEECFYDQ
ncbi:MAG: IS30 family transposase [Phycisphaerales bacterium]|nr:IS30 family transposase [Phycisphaerales bacterium]